VVGYSRLCPGQYLVWVVKRTAVPPSGDWRAFALRWAADAVERSIANGEAIVAKKLAHLLASEAFLPFDCVH
jgi:hypothetical protein